MAARAAELAMICLGVTSAALLVAYGLLGAGGTANALLFWIIVIAFLVYVGWDIRRDVRALRTRTPASGGRNV